jgi:hypothetical protein
MKYMKIFTMMFAVMFLAACGQLVEVPPANVGKIVTKDGYREGLVMPSKTRLEWCVVYCDKLVLLDVSDKAQQEAMTIFMPEDKLNLDLGIQVTLSLNANKTEALFNALTPQEVTSYLAKIDWAQIYNTYARQIILTETREYISQFTIAQIASSLEAVNADLRKRLQAIIEERTPFNVRYVGVTSITYPKIITDAQENAAERRERIQQEEAQLQISKVQLERELQETRLRRQIELEKAQIEAKSQEIQREVVDEKVLALRRLENQRLWIERWNGQLPVTMLADDSTVLMQLPQQQK